DAADGDADVAPLDGEEVDAELEVEVLAAALVAAVVDFDEPPHAARSPPAIPKPAPPATNRRNPRRFTRSRWSMVRELEASSGIMTSHLSLLDTLRAPSARSSKLA